MMIRSILSVASLALASAVTLHSSPNAADLGALHPSLNSFAQVAAAAGSEATLANTIADRRVVVKFADMAGDMQQKAIDTAIEAI